MIRILFVFLILFFPTLTATPANAQQASIMQGQYTCGQGSSDLRLSLTRRGTSELDAVFEFYSPRDRAAGSFRLAGSISSTGEFVLRPTEWVRRPTGYTMVGIRGRLAQEGRDANGRVESAGCGTFSVTLRSGPPIQVLQQAEDTRVGAPQFSAPQVTASPSIMASGLNENALNAEGLKHFLGQGVPIDYARAAQYFNVACELGNPAKKIGLNRESCYILGWQYENGKGVTVDLSNAAKLYKAACAPVLDEGRGCVALGLLLEFGRGVPQDLREAFAFYKKGCEGEAGQGCFMYGNMLYNGVPYSGTTKSQAAESFKEACYLKSYEGCNALGKMHESGFEVTQSAQLAAQLYTKACEGGFQEGCTNQRRLIGLGTVASEQQAGGLASKILDFNGADMLPISGRTPKQILASCKKGIEGDCSRYGWETSYPDSGSAQAWRTYEALETMNLLCERLSNARYCEAAGHIEKHFAAAKYQNEIDQITDARLCLEENYAVTGRQSTGTRYDVGKDEFVPQTEAVYSKGWRNKCRKEILVRATINNKSTVIDKIKPGEVKFNYNTCGSRRSEFEPCGDIRMTFN